MFSGNLACTQEKLELSKSISKREKQDKHHRAFLRIGMKVKTFHHSGVRARLLRCPWQLAGFPACSEALAGG